MSEIKQEFDGKLPYPYNLRDTEPRSTIFDGSKIKLKDLERALSRGERWGVVGTWFPK